MFTLEIKTDNAAFSFPEPEIARILEYIANRLRDTQPLGEGGWRWPLHDMNGNPVGNVHYLPED